MQLGSGHVRPKKSFADRGKASHDGIGDKSAKDNEFRRLLVSIGTAASVGESARALRLADRAWRLAPSSAEIATMFGRLLLVNGYAAAALRPLRRAVELRSCPDHAASLVVALLQAGQRTEAYTELSIALQRHVVAPNGELAAACRRILDERKRDRPGWIGIAPDLAIVGELVAHAPDAGVVVRTEDGGVWHQVRVEKTHSPHYRRFRVPPEVAAFPQLLKVEVAGRPLLGSPIRYPPDFAFDARATAAGGQVSGWVSLGWTPTASAEVVIETDEGQRVCLSTEPDQVNPSRRTFTLDLATSEVRGARRLWCAARLPDGMLERFPDAPLLLDVGIPATPSRHKRTRSAATKEEGSAQLHGAPSVDIIVPAYRGVDETRQCLQALLPARRDGVEIVVIDDASPEPELTTALQTLAADGSIRLLRNSSNLGFPASVNRGLAVHPQRDAVILNSDAIVHGDWLQRLQVAAYSAPDIGTVTPLASHGSVVSYPGGDEVDCTAEDAAGIDHLAATVNSGVLSEIPVGVGFCLYVRRDCLEETGDFDAETFGKGYGEENDFCLRARLRGWRHVVAGNVFVCHLGGRSFGTRRHALMERGRRIINMRYPGYDEAVEIFIRADSLLPIRRRIDEVRLTHDTRPVALLLTLALPGGVDRVVRKRCAILQRAGLRPVLLRPDKPDGRRCQVKVGDGEELRDLYYDVPAELPLLADLIGRLNVVHIELHHFLDLDPEVVELVRGLDVRYDAYVHDYSWICPRLTLLSGDNRYCGEPPLAQCEACIEDHGSSLPEDIGVAELRERSAHWLGEARRVIVPSRDTMQRMQRYFPDIRFRQRAWERPVRVATKTPAPSETVRVAIIGAIGVHKGFEVLRACADDAAARNLPLDFVVLGYSADDDELLETGTAFVTGRYEEDELADLLRRERPQLVWFPSVLPETWCFALTHALRAGLPIVAFDVGAVAERLRDLEAGTLLSSELSPAAVNDYMLLLAQASSPLPRQAKAPVAHPPAAETAFNKARDNLEGGTVMLKERTQSSPSQSLLAATVEAITLNQGLYLFYVRSATPVRESAGSENVTLPAVQVGLAPGNTVENVQFISGPQTRGDWLCEPGNMIVAKITGAPATLLITSIRKTGGQPLAIDVERLDGRSPIGDLAPEEPTKTPVPALPRHSNAVQTPLPPVLPSALPGPAAPNAPSAGFSDVRCEIITHVQNEGDRSFVDAPWAGELANTYGSRTSVSCL